MIYTRDYLELKEFLESIEFDESTWQIAILKYKSHPNFSKSNQHPFHEYERAFKDILVSECLRFFCAMNRHKRISRITFSNIDYDYLNRAYIKAENRLVILENLVKINSVPTLIESCIGRFVPEKRIKRQIETMVEFFDDYFGYMLYSPSAYFIAKRARTFVEDGGILARFPLEKEEFREKLLFYLNKFGLEIHESFTESEKIKSLIKEVG